MRGIRRGIEKESLRATADSHLALTPHPLALGFIGRNGTYPANQAGRHCDLLIAIGARFDDRSSSSWIPGYSWNIPPTRLVHVDIDPTEIGRNYPVTLGILADAKVFLTQLAQEAASRGLSGRRFAPWHELIGGWKREWDVFTRPHFDVSGAPLRPERVVEVAYDHMEGRRFRHTAQFRRWRTDRDPESCGYDQLEEVVSYDLGRILGLEGNPTS